MWFNMCSKDLEAELVILAKGNMVNVDVVLSYPVFREEVTWIPVWNTRQYTIKALYTSLVLAVKKYQMPHSGFLSGIKYLKN